MVRGRGIRVKEEDRSSVCGILSCGLDRPPDRVFCVFALADLDTCGISQCESDVGCMKLSPTRHLRHIFVAKPVCDQHAHLSIGQGWLLGLVGMVRRGTPLGHLDAAVPPHTIFLQGIATL